MHTLRVVPLLGILALAPAVSAQSSTGAPQTRVPTAADSAILRALDLPRVMHRAREVGIPDSSIRDVVDRMRQRGVPADEATMAVARGVETVERGGNREDFGTVVRAQVESGVRGRVPQSRGARPESVARPQVRGNRPPAGGPARQRPDSIDKPPTRGKRP